MADNVDRVSRSRMMSAVKARDTKIEVQLRSRLHHLGFRYRIDVRSLPGRPDLVLAKHHAAVFIHGCFWHGHDCPLFRWPSSNTEFWKEKITANQRRDAVSISLLQQQGWRVLTVWECVLRGRPSQEVDGVVAAAALWLQSNAATGEIRGCGP